MIIITLLCLITFSPYVDCKVITVNSSSANSFYNALQQKIENNTLINITSAAVPLHYHVYLRQLNNITIASKIGTIVMCNNTGAINCEGCIDITIEGITWDQCGNISDLSSAAINLLFVINISLVDCTFQKSSICTSVKIVNVGGNIDITTCNKFIVCYKHFLG